MGAWWERRVDAECTVAVWYGHCVVGRIEASQRDRMNIAEKMEERHGCSNPQPHTLGS